MTTGLVWHPLAHTMDAETAFMALYGEDPHALWWDDHGERGQQVSYLASGTPLDLTENWREELRVAHAALARASAEGAGEYPLGIVIVAPYETGVQAIGLPPHPLTTQADIVPRAVLVDRLIACDHRTQTLTAVALADTWSGELELWAERLENTLAQAPSPPPAVVGEVARLHWRDSPVRYREMILSAQDAIVRGDAYQLCVTTQIQVEGCVDPVALHRVLRQISPTHHQALIRMGPLSMVSASPETFLQIDPQGRVITRPIKGTRPRGATPGDDRALGVELSTNDKERAENLMIVDLMRNDFSRVCEVGSITVPELMVVENYATVHQLVSTVEGQIRSGCDVLDVLDATFPAGSMTGAPKARAVELLGTAESGPRGLYSGTYGVWRVDGSATFAMTIRTAMVHPTHLTIGVGGGITALSEPGAEIREVGIKARSLLQALGLEQGEYS